MNTLTDPTVADLEHLDFEPTCSCRVPLTKPPCGNTATWVLVKRCGHVGFSCNLCKGKTEAAPDAGWHCTTCWKHWNSLSEGVIEFRRL